MELERRRRISISLAVSKVDPPSDGGLYPILATTSDGIVLLDKGTGATKLVHPIPGGAGPVAFAASDPGTAYAVGSDRTLYRSTDAGASWAAVG